MWSENRENRSYPRDFLAVWNFSGKKICKTLNGRLPPKDGSVRPQTLGKRVLDDPRHFIFRRKKKQNWHKIFVKIFGGKNFRRKIGKMPVLEELRIFGRNRQMRLEKWAPRFRISALYDFWRRGKRDHFMFPSDFLVFCFVFFFSFLK